MYKILLALIISVLLSTLVQANWIVTFNDTYNAKGVDYAVEDALKEGKSPDMIMGIGLSIQGLNPQNLIRALYCAGAVGVDIRAAAEKYKIQEAITVAGYKKYIDECKSTDASSQRYTPTGNYTGRSGSFASPSTFAK